MPVHSPVVIRRLFCRYRLLCPLFSFSNFASTASGDGTVQLAYAKYGDKDSNNLAPLVIAHGLFGQKNNWHSMCKALCSRLKNQIYAIDLRNHGESPWRDQMDYDIMAADIARFIREVVLAETGFDKSHLLGHSMGGKAAMMLALGKESYLIDHLIIEDIAPKTYDRSSHGHFPAFVDAMKMANLSLTREEIEKHMADVVKDRLIRQFLLTNLVANNEKGGKMEWRCNLEAIGENLGKLIAFPDSKQFQENPCQLKTLFLHGGESAYVKLTDRDWIRKLFPNAEFEAVDAGHWIHSEQPAVLIVALEGFLGITTGDLPKKE